MFKIDYRMSANISLRGLRLMSNRSDANYFDNQDCIDVMKPISTVWIAIDISKKQLKKEFIHILIDDSYDTVLSRSSKLQMSLLFFGNSLDRKILINIFLINIYLKLEIVGN